MENRNLEFSLLNYYVEKRHIAPENVEDKVREDMDAMGLSVFADHFNICPTNNRSYDCFGEEYSEIFGTCWHIEFDDFDGSIDIKPVNANEHTVQFVAKIWELMICGDIEIKLGIVDNYSHLNTDEFDYLLQERRVFNRRFYYHMAQNNIHYYIDTTKGDGSISVKEATDENKKTLAFHIAEKAGYIYSNLNAAKRVAFHLAYAFDYKLV